MLFKTLLTSLAMTVLFTCSSVSGVLAQETININGSTTVLPIMQKELEAFLKLNKGVDMTLSGGGTSNGIKALMDGTAHIAMASRAVKDKELAEAKAKNVDFVEHVIALDAILPIVHPENPVKDLTVEQLRGIYEGKIKNWKEVGGKDESIVVVSRDTSSGTFDTWQEFVMGKDTKVFPAALMQASSGAVLQTVSKNRKAIGYEGIGYVNSSVKALAVGGVKGSEATAKDGTYPLSRHLQIYTNGAPQGMIKKFVDFILSKEGQELVIQAGFLKK